MSVLHCDCNNKINYRIFSLLSIFILLFIDIAFADCGDKYSALVYSDKDNQILFERRADEIIYPASLTKIMTAYLAFEALEKNQINLNQRIKISANIEDVSKVNKINTLMLKEFDEITVREAIEGMLTRSFNESAVALAELIAGDEWSFARKMNEKALELNMANTNFRNASGLHEAGHYTTIYDLARLINAIEKKFLQYRQYFAIRNLEFRGVKYKNTNNLLYDYEGVDGFKTGFTSIAGSNLAASAKRGGVRVNSIVTGCNGYKNRDEFTKELLDQAFVSIKLEQQNKISNSELKIFLK